MSSRFVLRFGLFALAALHVFATPIEPRAPACMKGVLFVAARGADPDWSEPETPDPNSDIIGALRPIANNVIKHTTNPSSVTTVSYSATKTDYEASVQEGIGQFQKLITAYVNSCPEARIMVLGFSQGCMVINGGLVGGLGYKALDYDTYGKHIIGGATFGDPTFVHGLVPLDAGNSTKSGTYSGNFMGEGINQTTLNELFGKRFRNYCQAGDRYCANAGTEGTAIHRREVITYTKEATNFLISVL